MMFRSHEICLAWTNPALLRTEVKMTDTPNFQKYAIPTQYVGTRIPRNLVGIRKTVTLAKAIQGGGWDGHQGREELFHFLFQITDENVS